MSRRLLILACSSVKRGGGGWLAARDRYDGPLWQTLRATDPEGAMASVGFLSARYGFGGADRPIQLYDQRLTPELAAQMIAGGMGTRWPRPPSPKKPDNYGDHPGMHIASMTNWGRRPFGEVALVGGQLYLDVMRAFVAGFQGMGGVTPGAQVTTINASIGVMRRELRAWLEAGQIAPAPAPRRRPEQLELALA